MPKIVPKFKDTLKFTFTHEQLGTVSWSWKDQIKQFWEDWIPKDKDLVIHTKLSKADFNSFYILLVVSLYFDDGDT